MVKVLAKDRRLQDRLYTGKDIIDGGYSYDEERERKEIKREIKERRRIRREQEYASILP